jgi:hypothetical protein
MRTFCVYDAPTPEAIRKRAAHNKLPVDRITRVRVLDPYFYSGTTGRSVTQYGCEARRHRWT